MGENVVKTSSTREELLAGAEDATNREHELTLLQAIKLYPKAVIWSIAMSAALVMDGYDGKLIAGFFAQPAFRKAYGDMQPNGSYGISASWQAALINGNNVGQLIGLLLAGYLSEAVGFRKTMAIGLVIMPPFILMQFLAPSLVVLQAAQILIGIPIGMFQTIVTVYAVEVMPTCLRPYLTSYNMGCWLIGQFISAGVLRSVLNLTSPWAYRIPFAIQWFWPIVLIIAVYFAPESPWWLVRQNRFEDARAALRRLTTHETETNIDKAIALISLTTQHEREVNADVRYISCFKGTELRRTIIVIGCYAMQIMSGSPLRGYVTYFFQQAGLPTDQAFNMSIIIYGIGLIGVMLCWLLMLKIGSRTLMLWGLGSACFMYIAVGGIGVPQSTSPQSGYAWGIGALLIVSSFVCNTTVAPVSFTLVASISSSIHRNKAVVISRWLFSVLNIACYVITPYQLSPTAWNWGAKVGFFWAGGCFLGFLFTYFMVPEPRGLTTAELDLLFEKRLPARQFKTTKVGISEAVV